MKKKMKYLIILLTAILMVACTDVEDAAISDVETIPQDIPTESNLNTEKEEANPTIVAEPVIEEISTQPNEDLFSGYKLIEVDGGDLSGYRESNVVVDIGYGEREYWAFTNEHGQLVRVIAEEINLQDDSTEPVLSSGRYYSDEAKVPGVESDFLDEGHIIADSLGGYRTLLNKT